MNSPKRVWLTRNIILLGIVSLLTDTATEMVIPLLPAFLTGVLGAGALALGLIEGLADAVASVLKLLAGRWADRMGRNRPFVLGGYALSSFARPLVALAAAPWHVLAVRMADRVGKGLRSSPRDAIIAGSVDPSVRGTAFSFHRAMDHAGAVLGPLLAAAILLFWTDDLRMIFALTVVPGLAAVLVIFYGVREGAKDVHVREGARQSAAKKVRGTSLARFLIPLGLFTLGNASDVFLLLKAGAERAPLVTLPLLWVGLHVVKMLVSIPGGRLADRWGRRRTIAVGWLVYAAVYTGFAFASSQSAIWGLFIVYGVYHGLTEGAERALVAEVTGAGRWGTAFGWYHMTLGLLALTASVLFGALWEVWGSQMAFLVSAALALSAVVLLWLLYPTVSGEE